MVQEYLVKAKMTRSCTGTWSKRAGAKLSCKRLGNFEENWKEGGGGKKKLGKREDQWIETLQFDNK